MSRHFANRPDSVWMRLSKLTFGSSRFSLRYRFACRLALCHSRVTQRCACSQTARAQTAEHKEMCIINFCRFILVIKPVTSQLTLLKVFWEYGRQPSGPSSSPGEGHCVVFFEHKISQFHSASLHPRCKCASETSAGVPLP